MIAQTTLQRKLEDKLVDHKLEFRSFFLPMDLTGLHHNRDMPGGFTFYMIVSDSCLPAKGTAHRASRSAGKAAGLNLFQFQKV